MKRVINFCARAVPLILLLATTMFSFASSCESNAVSFDSEKQQLIWNLKLAPGTQTIRLPTIQNADFPQWTLVSANAKLAGHSVTITSQHQRKVQLILAIPARIRRADRMYAPVLRFADGTLAVLSSNFNVEPASGANGCVQFDAGIRQQVVGFKQSGGSVVSVSSDVAGYVAFGTPEIVAGDSATFVLDRRLAPWASTRIVQTSESAIRYFQGELGVVPVPDIFGYTDPAAGDSAYHWGDRLPGSITLGLLGTGWEAPGEQRIGEIDAFLSHELFHIWNAIPTLSSDHDALLALEGGAELARVFALARSRTDRSAFILSSVSDAFNRCQFGLSKGSSASKALDTDHPGQLPYDCGMVVMFALASAGENSADAETTFFRSWKSVIAKHRETPYSWPDLAPVLAPANLVIQLNDALHTPDQFVAGATAALRMGRYNVVPATSISADARWYLATRLFASIMRQDCAGEVSFWTAQEGFRLDSNLPHCRALKANAVVTKIFGATLWDDPLSLSKRVLDACEKAHELSVEYADGTESGKIRCGEAIEALPTPMAITR